MGSIAPLPQAPPEAPSKPDVRVQTPAPAPAPAEPDVNIVAKAAEENLNEKLKEIRDSVLPAKHQVSLDHAAARFVQTVTDPSTGDVVLRYPNEEQLAFSRAVAAYVRAVSGR